MGVLAGNTSIFVYLEEGWYSPGVHKNNLAGAIFEELVFKNWSPNCPWEPNTSPILACQPNSKVASTQGIPLDLPTP